MLSSCIISISASMATSFIGPLDDGRGGWGKRLVFIECVILPTGNIVISIFKSNQTRKRIPENTEPIQKSFLRFRSSRSTLRPHLYLVRFLWRNRTNTEIYYKELPHIMMEEMKSHGLLSVTWAPRKASGMVPAQA